MIGIIDYGMSNLHSVKNACDYLNLDSVVSKDVSILSKCDKLILPGVGAFQDCMNTLHSIGLYDFIVQQVKKDIPLLGIRYTYNENGKLLISGPRKAPGKYSKIKKEKFSWKICSDVLQ